MLSSKDFESNGISEEGKAAVSIGIPDLCLRHKVWLESEQMLELSTGVNRQVRDETRRDLILTFG